MRDHIPGTGWLQWRKWAFIVVYFFKTCLSTNNPLHTIFFGGGTRMLWRYIITVDFVEIMELYRAKCNCCTPVIDLLFFSSSLRELLVAILDNTCMLWHWSLDSLLFQRVLSWSKSSISFFHMTALVVLSCL